MTHTDGCYRKHGWFHLLHRNHSMLNVHCSSLSIVLAFDSVCVCSNANWKHRKTKQLKRSELVIHQQKKCDFNLNSSTWKARRKYALQVYIILIWYSYMMIFIYDDIQLEHTIWSMPPFIRYIDLFVCSLVFLLLTSTLSLCLAERKKHTH